MISEAKTSIWLALSGELFSSYLGQILQSFLIGLFILKQIASSKFAQMLRRIKNFVTFHGKRSVLQSQRDS